MKGDSRVSLGMQHGRSTGHLWPGNVFLNKKLMYYKKQVKQTEPSTGALFKTDQTTVRIIVNESQNL